MDRVSNTWIRSCGKLQRGVDDRIVEGVLRQFGRVERMKNDMIAKRIYRGEWATNKLSSSPYTFPLSTLI